MEQFDNARHLLREFKGDRYVNGFDVLPRAGALAAALGRKVLFISDRFPGAESPAASIRSSLESAGLEVCGAIEGARPNAPREDLARIAAAVCSAGPGVLVSFGGGSTIDAAKAAAVLGSVGGTVD